PANVTHTAFYLQRDCVNFASYVSNKNRTVAMPHTTSTTADELPSSSPDGAYIAFDSNADIYLVKADGTGLLRVTRDRSTDIMPRRRPAPWSPRAGPGPDDDRAALAVGAGELQRRLGQGPADLDSAAPDGRHRDAGASGSPD